MDMNRAPKASTCSNAISERDAVVDNTANMMRQTVTEPANINASLIEISTENYSWSLLDMGASNTTLSFNVDQFTSPAHSTHTNDSSLILQQLNDEKARLYIPVLVYMAILLIIGTLGNIIAILVYADVKKKSSADYFILCISILDLLSCVVGMPAELYDLSFPFMYYSSVACKILRYIQSCTTLSSIFILVLVAFDRYFLICKINRVIKASQMKKISIIIIAVAFVVCTPSGVINGITPIEMGIGGVTGYACLIENSLRHTQYPALWYAFLMLVFVITVVIISVLYIRISYEVWKRKKIMAPRATFQMENKGSDGTNPKGTCPTTNTTSSTIPENSDITTEIGASTATEISKNHTETIPESSDISNAIGASTTTEISKKHIETIPESSDISTEIGVPTASEISANHTDPKRKSSDIFIDIDLTSASEIAKNYASTIPDSNATEIGAKSGSQISRNDTNTPKNDVPRKSRPDDVIKQYTKQNQSTRSRSTALNPLRTTFILFVVTLVFVLSFLPFLTVTVLRSVIRNYEKSLNDVTEVVHKFCLRSYFINNSGNPLIYSFLNASFRRRAIRKLKYIWCCKMNE